MRKIYTYVAFNQIIRKKLKLLFLFYYIVIKIKIYNFNKSI